MVHIELPPGCEPPAPRMLKAQRPIPVSIWQRLANEWYYSGHGDPLKLFGTLGTNDPVLPRAISADLLGREPPVTAVHEIGPGNFHVAKAIMGFVRAQAHRNLQYRCYDAHATSYTYHRHRLPTEGFSFMQKGVESFPALTREQEAVHVLCVELFDDTDTEHALLHKGQEQMLCVLPCLPNDTVMESRSLAASQLAHMGDFSQAHALLSDAGSTGLEKLYDADDIMAMIDGMDIERLRKVHPSFLLRLQYENHAFPLPLETSIGKRFEQADAPCLRYVRQVMEYFRKQLRSVPDGNAIGFPVAGVKFLWEMRDHAGARIDLFDYGYTNADLCHRDNPLSCSVFQGQLTSPVNFDLLKYAATECGFDARLEPTEEYILRHTGLDTIPLSRLLSNAEYACDRGKISSKDLKTLLRAFTAGSVLGTRDEDPVDDSHMNMRITYEQAMAFVDMLRGRGFLKQPVDMRRCSYHLSASRQ